MERSGRLAGKIRRWMVLGGVVLVLAGAAAASLFGPARGTGAAPPGRNSLSAPELAGRWGIDELTVSRSAAGQLLDFRYRVVDAEKAAPLQHKESKPYLVDVKSGKRLGVPSTPKTGALWNHGGARAGRRYFALFSNPGRLVKKGDRVSVVVGKLVVENLVVD